MSDTTTATAELAAFNGRWLEDVRQHLSPACAPHSDFWDRRAAMQYLAGPFAETYRRSGELLDALLGCLDPPTAGRLVDDRAALDDLRADFEDIGRERGNAVAAAAIGCSLLATLQRWCRQMENAVLAVGSERLSLGARDALSRLTVPGAAPPS
jgi:hypothetical protein